MIEIQAKPAQRFDLPSYIYKKCDDGDCTQNGINLSICKAISIVKGETLEFDCDKELLEIIVSNLLSDNNLKELSVDISRKIKRIEQNYKNVTEEFSMVLNKWLKLRKETLLTLQKSKQKFHLLQKATAGLTLISSTAELATSLGLMLRNIFHFKVDLPLLMVSILSGISFTSSLLALTYSRSKLEDITRGMREEKHRLSDFQRLYYRGKWIDKAVQQLFPFGIDLDLLESSKQQDLSWRHDLCSAIILTNLKRDKKVLEDPDFLLTVKAFVQSSAAEIWLNRIKLREFLDAMSSKSETLSDKEIKSSSEVFLNGAAFSLFPLFYPLWARTGSTEKMQFFFSSVAVIKTALDLLDNETDEFQEMNNVVATLKEEYRNIKKMNSCLISDYD